MFLEYEYIFLYTCRKITNLMSNDFVCVYSHTNQYTIDILKSVLQEHGVESVVLNKQDSSYHFGSIELYVKPADESLARQIITEFESNHEK